MKTQIFTKKGFTLIELLVVVLIIGILAAIAVPQYQKAVVKSRLANLKFLATAIRNAQEAHFLATGEYTINPQELDISLPTPNEITEKEDRVYYVYDWGNCDIHSVLTNCTYGDSLNYGIYYSNVNWAGLDNHAQCCGISDTEKQVCQQETGKTTPFWTGENGDTCYSY